MKRITQILLFSILFNLLCPLTAFASEIYTEGYFKYTVEDDSVSIHEYYGKESEVTVPSMIAGNPVSTIAKGAFSDNTYVKKVNLPDTIMTIEKDAFASGISIIYDSNTNSPAESSSASSTPTASDSPDISQNNSSSADKQQSDSYAPDTDKIGIEETETSLEETETSLEETDLLAENETDSGTITPGAETESSIDETESLPNSASIHDSSESKANTTIIVAIIVIIIIILILGIGLYIKSRKKKR